MAVVSMRICRLPRHTSPCKLSARTLVSATPRSTSPSARIRRSPALHASSSTAVPDLCLGAGGKAPGFVQQMLFSAPVQDRNAKEQINQSIRVFLGDKTSPNGNAPNVQNNPSLPPSPFKYSH